MSRPARLAILVSGRGSNLLSLHRAIEAGEVPARIVLVLSNRPEALGLERASELGLRTAAVPRLRGTSRAEHEAGILEELRSSEPDWVCLAGYMRRLTADFVRRYPRRILNIHPSLLPSFPGLDAQRQALEHGVRISGCTVHLVDEGVDTGPIVLQKAVPVEDTDDPESLAARILEAEHRAYPEALRRLLSEPWRVDGRRVLFGSPSDS